MGREIVTLVNEMQEPGYKSVNWHGRDQLGSKVSAGMYFYLINAGNFTKIKKNDFIEVIPHVGFFVYGMMGLYCRRFISTAMPAY